MISRLLFMLFVVVVQAKKPTIMDVLKNDGRFGILVSALESACLHDYLRKATGGHRSDEYTVFGVKLCVDCLRYILHLFSALQLPQMKHLNLSPHKKWNIFNLIYTRSFNIMLLRRKL